MRVQAEMAEFVKRDWLLTVKHSKMNGRIHKIRLNYEMKQSVQWNGQGNQKKWWNSAE